MAVAPRPRGWRIAALALLIYAAFLFASAPASVFAWAIGVATNGVAILEGTQGVLWRGHARTVLIRDRSGAEHRYERLRWEWLGTRVTTGEIAFRIGIQDPKLRGDVQVALRPGRIQASDAAFHFAASALAGYVPRLAPAGLSGDLTLRSGGFSFGNDGFSGAATIEWRNAASVLSSVRPLGQYRAVVAGAGSRLEFRVDSLRGALLIDGHGTWSKKAGLSFEGAARAIPDYGIELTQLLGPLGQHRAGAHPISITALHPMTP